MKRKFQYVSVLYAFFSHFGFLSSSGAAKEFLFENLVLQSKAPIICVLLFTRLFSIYRYALDVCSVWFENNDLKCSLSLSGKWAFILRLLMKSRYLLLGISDFFFVTQPIVRLPSYAVFTGEIHHIRLLFQCLVPNGSSSLLICPIFQIWHFSHNSRYRALLI